MTAGVVTRVQSGGCPANRPGGRRRKKGGPIRHGQLVARAAIVFVLAACGDAIHDPPKDQAYWDAWPWMTTTIVGPAQFAGALAADTLPSSFGVMLAVTNTGSTPVRLEHGACSFGLRLYRSAASSLPPAWDDRPPAGSACPLPLYQVTVAPGVRHEQRIGSIKVAATGLPPGRYWASITWRPSANEVRLVAAGVLDIP